MSKVKIPIPGTIGKSITFEANATIGATLGADLFGPNGNVLTVAELATLLGVVTVDAVEAAAGVSDHTLLTSIGVNSHAAIDAHLASVSNPHLTNLGGLTDVTIASPALNHVIYFDGVDWDNIDVNALVSTSPNLDGGRSDSNYGGIAAIDGGDST